MAKNTADLKMCNYPAAGQRVAEQAKRVGELVASRYALGHLQWLGHARSFGFVHFFAEAVDWNTTLFINLFIYLLSIQLSVYLFLFTDSQWWIRKFCFTHKHLYIDMKDQLFRYKLRFYFIYLHLCKYSTTYSLVHSLSHLFICWI